MPLTILTDANVKDLLSKLTRDDVESLQVSMRNALHEYSTGTTNSGACADNQPSRTVIESKSNGTTTLFMPSTSSNGIGMKVVTLGAPSSEAQDATASELDIPQSNNTTPQGAMTLMSNDGKPYGFINAEEVTAFRTALASSLLMMRRSRVKNLAVFGVGKQAYWHVRLALLLHGSTIKKVHFINREFNERARDTMKRFISHDAAQKEKEGWSSCTFDLISTNYNEISRILKDNLRNADIIFCTTPSTEPLFDNTILTNTEGRKKGRLIIAVGSYKKHMIEIPTEVIQQAVKRHGSGHHFHKHAEEGGVVVVDTLSCLKETGELVGLLPNQSVELGELVMLDNMVNQFESPSDESSTPSLESLSLDANSRPNHMASVFREDSISTTNSGSTGKSLSHRSSFTLHHRRTNSSSSHGSKRKKQTEKENEMCRWLSSGNVIYKSVGMGLMDLVVGADLVRIAHKRAIGISVSDF